MQTGRTFERFTDRARRVLVLAQDEARLLGHGFIGTEHLLLGLISEGDGVAAKVLASFRISLETVRERVEEMIGESAAAPTGSPPFTPRAKKVLELSLREALQMGHNYIGTEHILLGLIREGEGVAAQVLISLGAGLSAVRQRVLQLLTGQGGADPEMRRMARRHIEGAFALLSDRDREVMAYRLGLTAAQARTIEQTGDRFGLHHSRVREIEREMLAALADEIPETSSDEVREKLLGERWRADVVRTGRQLSDVVEAYRALAEMLERQGIDIQGVESTAISVQSVETDDGPGIKLSVEVTLGSPVETASGDAPVSEPPESDGTRDASPGDPEASDS